MSCAENNTMASFSYVYEGPYCIIKKYNNYTYKLQYTDNEKIRGVFHIDNLKPYVHETE